MSLPELLYTALSGHAGLAALVSDRIYPIKLPQDETLPAVVYQQISVQNMITLDTDTNGVQQIRVQLSAWSSSYDEARAVGEQVRLAMESATTFRAVRILETDDHDPDTGEYRSLADYSVLTYP